MVLYLNCINIYIKLVNELNTKKIRNEMDNVNVTKRRWKITKVKFRK